MALEAQVRVERPGVVAGLLGAAFERALELGDERRVGDPPTAGTRVNPQRFGSPRSSAPLAAGVSLRSPRTSDSTFGSRFGSGGRARVYGVGSPGPAYGSAQRL